LADPPQLGRDTRGTFHLPVFVFDRGAFGNDFRFWESILIPATFVLRALS